MSHHKDINKHSKDVNDKKEVKDVKDVNDYKKIKTGIIGYLKKREQEYNQIAHISTTEIHKFYHENIVVCTFMDKKYTSYQNKKKAIEIEKKTYTNTDKQKNIKISSPVFYELCDGLLGVEYQIVHCDNMNTELQSMIEKLTIKDVDMNKLINDLNENGINVNNLLQEFTKHGRNLDSLLEYLNNQKINPTTIMNILYKNGVTINALTQNEFIHDLIKQSPTYSWFLNGKELPKASKHEKIEKHVNKINVYAIYKIKHDDAIIVNINWTTL